MEPTIPRINSIEVSKRNFTIFFWTVVYLLMSYFFFLYKILYEKVEYGAYHDCCALNFAMSYNE